MSIFEGVGAICRHGKDRAQLRSYTVTQLHKVKLICEFRSEMLFILLYIL